MADHTFNTVVLQGYLDRMKDGDKAAENELIKAVQVRLRALVARMFKAFPNVRPIADIDDVYQGSVMRLLSTLHVIRPVTTRDFMNLAAVHIQRELLDLARRARGKRTFPLGSEGSTDTPPQAMPVAREEPDMDEWVELHEAIDRLPADEREVVRLRFYNGWKLGQIAELLGVSERTVRRHWVDACKRIRKLSRFEREDDEG
jgi:RNA polymerase sigma factor (sigma-70 family)